MLITIYSLVVPKPGGNRVFVVTADTAAQYPAEIVKKYEISCKEYDGGAALTYGQLIAKSNVFNAIGLGDAAAIEAVKGRYMMQVLATGWNRTDDAGNPLPISTEAIATLPKPVLIEFARQADQGGPDVTQAEMDALKNEPASSGNDTAN